MDKQQYVSTLLKWLKENNIPVNQVHVSHGGSMLMLGLKTSTDDIDLTVTQEVFDRFDDELHPWKDLGDGRYLIEVTGLIDIHLSEKEIEDHQLIKDPSGIYYRDARTTWQDYKTLNRDKDQINFTLLEPIIADENKQWLDDYKANANQ